MYRYEILKISEKKHIFNEYITQLNKEEKVFFKILNACIEIWVFWIMCFCKLLIPSKLRKRSESRRESFVKVSCSCFKNAQISITICQSGKQFLLSMNFCILCSLYFVPHGSRYWSLAQESHIHSRERPTFQCCGDGER